tara:strand:- start:1766 stop:3091 length:1326 start_codon:yes stop_codon:yes gene_type:complete
MAIPTLTPSSQASKSILTSTGSAGSYPNQGDTAAEVKVYPFAIYADAGSPLYDTNFVSGASDQVSYTYKMLGGDVLDVELTPAAVYAHYELACLEYSYHINSHQAKNVLANLLGMTTGTFDHDGHMTNSGSIGSNINLKLPRYEFRYAKRVADGAAQEAGFGGSLTEYSASFDVIKNVQDYDLQSVISSSAAEGGTDSSTGDTPDFSRLVKGNKVTIRRVFYKTPQSTWRFYGYFGGLNVVGNLNHYGQFADDTTFEIIPTFHNKLQAMAFEDHLYTRLSHYSYEIHNNKLRIYPAPDGDHPDHMWVSFTLQKDGWQEDNDRQSGIEGINNMNTLPFDNVPFQNINAIGKQWIRRYALALSKETLAHIRGKFTTIPIPGESVTLNHSELMSQAKEEQKALKEELKTMLDEMTYKALAEQEAAVLTAVDTVQQEVPLLIYHG